MPPSKFEYEEAERLPGSTLLHKLAHVSQLDKLDDTDADYARCSAAATLSAYLLLGGDFAAIAEKTGVDGALTFANVHLLQEALYDIANTDGRPGVFGTCKPDYDDEGRLIGWAHNEGDEYHAIVDALGLSMTRVYAPTRDDPTELRAAVLDFLATPEDVVFVVGVDEDMAKERFVPMDETGNHYVAMFQRGDTVYALDSYRTPGRSALVVLSPVDVEAHLFRTRNAIYALRR